MTAQQTLNSIARSKLGSAPKKWILAVDDDSNDPYWMDAAIAGASKEARPKAVKGVLKTIKSLSGVKNHLDGYPTSRDGSKPVFITSPRALSDVSAQRAQGL